MGYAVLDGELRAATVDSWSNILAVSTEMHAYFALNMYNIWDKHLQSP